MELKMKNLSISMNDWVYDVHLSYCKNKSRQIEKAVILLGDIETGQLEKTKGQNIKLNNEIRNKIDEIKKLKTELGRVNKNYNNLKDKKTESSKVSEINLNVYSEVAQDFLNNEAVPNCSRYGYDGLYNRFVAEFGYDLKKSEFISLVNNLKKKDGVKDE
jgi:hypothetical protein